MFNALIVSIVTLVILVAVGWWQLYKAETTNTFFYRVTRVLPLPVASIDGESVRYGDYLMRYRSQEHFERSKPGQVDIDSSDGKRLLDSYKRSALDQIEADTYAAKLARELNITVTEAEINQVVERSLETSNGKISQELYDASTLDTLGYGPEEYRLIIRQSLIRQKVAYKIDQKADQQKNQVAALIQVKDADFTTVATTVGGTGEQQVTVGASGLVRKNNQDGGLSTAALKLQKGQTSPVVESTTGDGYYFVRLLDVTDTQLSYEYIKIPLTTFRTTVASLKKDGKVKEYISVASTIDQTVKQ
ncbi:MAG: SurA N-terminal domain-containing protein [Candidatus Saccharibacteria bacterium]